MKIKLNPIIDFGKMPIANAFCTRDQFAEEFFYNLVLGFDIKTKAIGLVNPLPLKKMFHDHYAFYSSTSKGMQIHFAQTARKLLPIANLPAGKAGKGLVVELGSNDGIMLEAWKKLGIGAIGVEPSKNVADVSISAGHDVITKFLSDKVVNEILFRGKVSLVYSANTFCQFEDLSQYLGYVIKLIGRNGVFVFEDPYFLDIFKKTSYDQIYDEHVWYFTVSFINNMLKPFGYHVFDCEHITVHGGELRMYVGHKDNFPVKQSVAIWLAKEEGLEQKLEILGRNIKKSKAQLLEILNRIKKEGKTICGFGATSKATTIFNYCGIGPDLIPNVFDNTPIKIGKYYPGVHIPIISQEVFEEGKSNPNKKIDYAFLGAWNHFKEINKYHSWYTKAGGHWITHVPTPKII